MRLITAAILVAISTMPAYAQYSAPPLAAMYGPQFQPQRPQQPIPPPTSYQNMGNFTYGSDGSTTQRMGQFSYTTTQDGRHITCQTMGTETMCN